MYRRTHIDAHPLDVCLDTLGNVYARFFYKQGFVLFSKQLFTKTQTPFAVCSVNMKIMNDAGRVWRKLWFYYPDFTSMKKNYENLARQRNFWHSSINSTASELDLKKSFATIIFLIKCGIILAPYNTAALNGTLSPTPCFNTLERSLKLAACSTVNTPNNQENLG